jgi:tRNA(fMet)-specific endonuclease VapC
VAEGLILETTFLVDLERERRSGVPGPAHAFLEAHPEDRLCVTVHTAGELASGVDSLERPQWEALLGHLQVLPVDLEACWRYGRVFRFLKDNGLLIGSNDLWIAAIALAQDLPLVTANEAHFKRVPELTVIAYR